MDKYKKIRRIGEGSFGIAILAKVKRSGKYVVIKEVNLSKLSKSDQEISRKEVDVLSQLKHCNIVTYLDSYESRDVLALVMDYCDGGDLSERIKAQKGSLFQEDQILNWFVQLCLAVKYIHDKNILHRDIKTQNLFLTKHGLLKLGDFGIAKVLNSTGDLARTCIGTPYYLSPEICRGLLYDNKSDIWSMGCVLYELAALKHAFEADNIQGLISKIMNAIYPEIPSRYGMELKATVNSMLKKDPSARPCCDVLLKKPLLQNRLKHLLSDLGLDLDPNARQAPIQNDSLIYIAGVPFPKPRDVGIVKAVQRPSSCEPHNVRSNHEMVTRSNKENVSSRNNNNNLVNYADNNKHNYNHHHHHLRKPLHLNTSRKDSTLKLTNKNKRIGVKPRAALKRMNIPSHNNINNVDHHDSTLKTGKIRTPSIHPSFKRPSPSIYPSHHHRGSPANHHHLPRPGVSLQNRQQQKPPSNVSNLQNQVHFPIRQLALEENEEITDNNDVINSFSNQNNNITNINDHAKGKTPVQPCVSSFLDYEPSPGRLWEEERKKRDQEYLVRFREIGLDNLREKFHKKMVQLESYNAFNPITGLPRCGVEPQASSSSVDEMRRRKLALIKAQVDVRVALIRKELEDKRREEFIRESSRISKDNDSYEEIPEIENGDSSHCSKVYENNSQTKRSTILKLISNHMSKSRVHDDGEHQPTDDSEKNTAKFSTEETENNCQIKWREVGHCTNLIRLGLEDNQCNNAIGYETNRSIRKRRHWSPMTDTFIINLNSASITASLDMSNRESLGSTLGEDPTLLNDDGGFSFTELENVDIQRLREEDDGCGGEAIGENEDDDDDDGGDINDDDGKDCKHHYHDHYDGHDIYNNQINESYDVPTLNHLTNAVYNHEEEDDDDSDDGDDDDDDKDIEKSERFLKNLSNFLALNKEVKSSNRVRGWTNCELHSPVTKEVMKEMNSCNSLDSRMKAIQIKDLNSRPFDSNHYNFRRYAFEDRIINNKCLKVNLIEGNETNELLRIEEQKSHNDCGRVIISKGRDLVNDEEERRRKKKMAILDIINKSLEVKRAWSVPENTAFVDDDDDGGGGDDDDGDGGGGGDDGGGDVIKSFTGGDDEEDEEDDVEQFDKNNINNGDDEDDYDFRDLEEMEKVMEDNLVDSSVINTEDVIIGDVAIKKSGRKRSNISRIIIRKPRVMVKMRRRKRKMVNIGSGSSWASTSIEDLHTMKNLLESYQDGVSS